MNKNKYNRPLSVQGNSKKRQYNRITNNVEQGNYSQPKQQSNSRPVTSSTIQGKLMRGAVFSKANKQEDENETFQQFQYLTNQQFGNNQQYQKQRPFTGQNYNYQQKHLNFKDNTINMNNTITRDQIKMQLQQNKKQKAPRTAPLGKTRSQYMINEKTSWLNKNIEKQYNQLIDQRQKKQEKPLINPGSEIIQSREYNNLYFTKVGLRSILKELNFDPQLISLTNKDERIEELYIITQHIFREIQMEKHNLLICRHKITNKFQIFFSDAEYIPISKCCNSPVFIEIDDSQKGKILCNSKECKKQLLLDFQACYDRENNIHKTKLPNEKISEAVSNLIMTGQFKKSNLNKKIKQATYSHNFKPSYLNFKKQQNQQDNNLQNIQQLNPQFEDQQIQNKNQNTYGQEDFQLKSNSLFNSRKIQKFQKDQDIYQQNNIDIIDKTQVKKQNLNLNLNMDKNYNNYQQQNQQKGYQLEQEQTLLDIKNMINDLLG